MRVIKHTDNFVLVHRILEADFNKHICNLTLRYTLWAMLQTK